MSRLIGYVEPFVSGGNFLAYEDRVRQFIKVNDIKEEETLTPLFITIAGAEIHELLISLTVPDLPSAKTFEELISLLRAHFAPKHNKRAERYKFNKLKQEDGEPINEFIVRLKAQAQFCNFGDIIPEKAKEDVHKYKIKMLDDVLSDRFIVGLTLPANYLPKQTVARHPSSTQHPTSGGSYEKNRRRKLPSSSQKSCHRCGNNHQQENCPAKRDNWECFTCHKVGHTSRVCRYRKAQSLQKVGINIVSAEEEKSPRASNQSPKASNQSPRASSHHPEPAECSLLINNVRTSFEIDSGAAVTIMSEPAECSLLINNVRTSFEIDSEAAVTIMSEKQYYDYFSNVQLKKSCNNLCTVLGNKIEELGIMSVMVEFGSGCWNCEIIVVKGGWPRKPLLGRDFQDVLFPNWRKIFTESVTGMNNIRSEVVCPILNSIQENYPSIVDSQNKDPIKGFTANIVLDGVQKPIFHCAYSVPFKLRDRVKAELNRLVDEKILEPIKFSRWATPIVIVPKANGELRICMDCKVTINKCILMQHYPLPKMDEIFAELADCEVFCVIDLRGAYQQLSVDENCKELLVINTLIGLLGYTRLPYGVLAHLQFFNPSWTECCLELRVYFVT
ncbi:uncharacterized protein K02A2.6-like [Eupeodes corollae]|uniref:uncharacterized protein K02A2.6-like n=1 Tax=Eupeodes corollae TaxID=290404 RepID=UPI002492B2FF|nr:uncharacterized protein K02A2.6-like [Eupeodes corollae]